MHIHVLFIIRFITVLALLFLYLRLAFSRRPDKRNKDKRKHSFDQHTKEHWGDAD